MHLSFVEVRMAPNTDTEMRRSSSHPLPSADAPLRSTQPRSAGQDDPMPDDLDDEVAFRILDIAATKAEQRGLYR